MADGTETAVSSIALRIHHQHVVSGELGAGKNGAGLVGSKFISINRASGTCRTLVRSKTHTSLCWFTVRGARDLHNQSEMVPSSSVVSEWDSLFLKLLHHGATNVPLWRKTSN